MPEQIKRVVETYLHLFADEHARLAQLADLIKHNAEDSTLLSRTSFVGHVTASGIVISRRSKRVLLIHKKDLAIYLQPGGHVLSTDLSPLDAARRKVAEETGLTNLIHVPYHANPLVPTDIDTHTIPASMLKGEPRHWHHDFRYVFVYEGDDEAVRINPDKLDSHRWFEGTELARMRTFEPLVKKLIRVFSPRSRHRRFYSELAQAFPVPERPAVVVIAHFLPDVDVYLEALDAISDLSLVLPKPRSIHQPTLRKLQERYSISSLSRADLATSGKIQSALESTTLPTILLDIGGYFAPFVNELKRRFSQVVGVVEDTENGHQRYERSPTLHVPVCSVARSPLKDTEDFLVGQTILFSTDALLRGVGLLSQYLRCGILGYGKIGRSIAYHLLQRGVKPSVYDTDSIRRMQACNQLCDVPSRESVVRESEVLFCATGNQALNIHDFRSMKPGCFVVSVTSSDDEMDMKYLEAEYAREEVGPFVARFESFHNYFYLVNDGNAANFIHHAVLGDFIHIVRAEMLVGIKRLMERNTPDGLFELDTSTRRAIAALWLRVFKEDDLIIGS